MAIYTLTLVFFERILNGFKVDSTIYMCRTGAEGMSMVKTTEGVNYPGKFELLGMEDETKSEFMFVTKVAQEE
jgi:hypothetical protein